MLVGPACWLGSLTFILAETATVWKKLPWRSLGTGSQQGSHNCCLRLLLWWRAPPPLPASFCRRSPRRRCWGFSTAARVWESVRQAFDPHQLGRFQERLKTILFNIHLTQVDELQDGLKRWHRLVYHLWLFVLEFRWNKYKPVNRGREHLWGQELDVANCWSLSEDPCRLEIKRNPNPDAFDGMKGSL